MPILIQMSGMPGSGKSTIAKLVGQELPAVVLDYDVTKTALLDQEISFGDAGRLAYETGYAMAESILGQGVNVILDSPCRFVRILTAGLYAAEKTDACYRYVECFLSDDSELQQRILRRPRLRSQVVDLGVPSPDAQDRRPLPGATTGSPSVVDSTVRPMEGHLRVDTSAPIEQCIAEVMRYIRGDTRVIVDPKHLSAV